MNWPWFLKPLDARSSDRFFGSIAEILALSCGFAAIFAAIGFTVGALGLAAPDFVVLVVVAVLEVIVGVLDFGPVTCVCGAAGWPCCGSASAGAPARHVAAAATPMSVRAKDMRPPP